MQKKNSIISIDFKPYLQQLLIEMQSDSVYFEVLNDLLFETSSSIFAWINNLFNDKMEIGKPRHSSAVVPKMCTSDEVARIDFRSRNGSVTISDTYSFFSKILCTSKDEVKDRFPSRFYVFDRHFFSNIDSFFFKVFEDFKVELHDRDTYIKRINENLVLKFRRVSKYHWHDDVSNYLFPQFIVEINKEEYFLFKSFDFRSLLFLPGQSFSFFYQESMEFVKDDLGRVTKAVIKAGQPVIYQSEGGYTITNSYEKLEIYNKYILILMDYFRSIFDIFEPFVVQQLCKRR